VVVKMHAIQALQALINLEVFDISQLKLHVVSAVEALCLLVRQLEESDCKVSVLEVAGELISLLSVQMTALKPLVQPLAGYLESLWSETAPSDPARNAILEVMQGLVRAAKHSAASILPVTTPLISFACNTHAMEDDRGGVPRSVTRCLSELACVKGDRANCPRACTGASDNGYLVRDGVALWLAVMRNLTEQQYLQYQAELQQLFIVAMGGLGLGGPADCETVKTVAGSGWDLLSDPDCAEIIRSLMLVIEAYALLGGESQSLLLDGRCQAAITALYCTALGKVEAGQVRYVVRPLQAFLLSCPILTGQYLNDCGILVHVLSICFTAVECGNLRKLFEQHTESDLAVTSYLTLVAQFLLFNPSALFAALSRVKVDVLAYVQHTTGQADEKMLTEGILITELVNLMFRLYDSLASSVAAPVFTAKLWCLALLSLLPPTMLANKAVVPPGMEANKDCTASHRPECIMGRMMLLIMSTLQFTIGRAKLEQFQRSHCHSHTAPPVDYFSLCFWFPSTLSAEQLYAWVAPIVEVCKGSLKQERSRRASQQMRRDVSALISATSEDDGSDSQDEASDSDSSDRAGSYDASMKDGGSEQDEAAVGAAITAQEGDAQRLDVADEPIVLVHKARMEQSGLLTASLEAHLTQKFTQLCRTLGEEQFSSLTCVVELGL
jgi:hypothetical protein